MIGVYVKAGRSASRPSARPLFQRDYTAADVELLASVDQANGGCQSFNFYIKNNCDFIPNFGERWRQGERISTALLAFSIISSASATVATDYVT